MFALQGIHRLGPRSSLVPLVVLALCLLSALAMGPSPISAYEPWWVQNFTETALWSGAEPGAVSFGRVPQWSHFLVVAPQRGPRLYVLNPKTNNYAYIDASAVGPSSAPTVPAVGPSPEPTGSPTEATAQTIDLPKRTLPRLPADYQPWWVANYVETEWWSGPEPGASSLGKVPQLRRFMVVEPQNGERLRVWSPETNGFGYLNATTVGPSGPSIWMDVRPAKVIRRVQLPGRSIGQTAYVRVLPIYDDETELRRVPNNTALDIRDYVTAADGSGWYTVGSEGFIRASEVRLPRPVETKQSGRWIDADLSEPAMVTAYEGDKIVHSALAIKGTTATSTPKGTFQILRRVEDETMDSETIGIPKDGPGGYYLKNVLYTQYFTNDGASLHYNYWLGTFGYAGSHGCLGLSQADAKWLWDWASVGTPVVIR